MLPPLLVKTVIRFYSEATCSGATHSLNVWNPARPAAVIAVVQARLTHPVKALAF